MQQCQAKRGFFTLYDCPKSARSRCPRCQRYLCSEHMHQTTDICFECEAKSDSEKATHPMVSTYRKRHEMLTRNNAIYYGNSLPQFYDEYDVRAFDVELANIQALSDSPDELFYDS